MPPIGRCGKPGFALGNIPWGAHICIFYETKEDLLDAATAYFAAGLKSNELCL